MTQEVETEKEKGATEGKIRRESNAREIRDEISESPIRTKDQKKKKIEITGKGSIDKKGETERN